MPKKRLPGKRASARRKSNSSSRRKTERLRNAQLHAQKRALSVLRRMRRTGASLAAACRAEHMDPRTARKLLGKQLRRSRSSKRYIATKSDRLLRNMKSPTATGMVPTTIRGSKEASILGRYLSTVGKFLRGKANADALREFEGKSVGGRPLITDLDTLRKLAHAGALQPEDIYAGPQVSS
jgi:hypothetical protein